MSGYYNMLYFLVLVLLSASYALEETKGLLDFLFSPCKCRCGVPNREARLIGGEPTRIHEFPWSSLIQIKGNEKQVPATLINNKYVITVASRILGLTPYDLKVTIGQHSRCQEDSSSLNISVDRIVIHPDYSDETKAHDLALIRLNTPINFERRMSPICLSTPSTKYLGQVATVLGWSNEDPPQEKSHCIPKKLGLPVLELKSCLQNLNNPELIVTEDKACVGVIGSKSPVCTNDAGSPVMFRSYGGVYELIGILTDFNDCKLESNIAFYSNINDHLSWITQTTRDACYCFKV